MAWNFSGNINANWVPDGAGPMSVPSMQTLQLDIGPLATLTLGMLGLGGLHVAERINGAS